MSQLYKEYRDTFDSAITEAFGENITLENDYFGLMTESVGDTIKEGIKKIIDAIHALIKKITEVFSSSAISAEEKIAFEEFKKKAEANPELGKMKITITDFRKMNAAYDMAIKEAEAARDKGEDPERLIPKIEGNLKKALAAIGISIGVIGAIELIKNNSLVAETFSRVLNNNEKAAETIASAVGGENLMDMKDAANGPQKKMRFMGFINNLVGRKAAHNNKARRSALQLIKGAKSGDPAATGELINRSAKGDFTGSEKVIMRAAGTGMQVVGGAKDVGAGIKKLGNSVFGKKDK